MNVKILILTLALFSINTPLAPAQNFLERVALGRFFKTIEDPEPVSIKPAAARLDGWYSLRIPGADSFVCFDSVEASITFAKRNYLGEIVYESVGLYDINYPVNLLWIFEPDSCEPGGFKTYLYNISAAGDFWYLTSGESAMILEPLGPVR